MVGTRRSSPRQSLAPSSKIVTGRRSAESLATTKASTPRDKVQKTNSKDRKSQPDVAVVCKKGDVALSADVGRKSRRSAGVVEEDGSVEDTMGKRHRQVSEKMKQWMDEQKSAQKRKIERKKRAVTSPSSAQATKKRKLTRGDNCDDTKVIQDPLVSDAELTLNETVDSSCIEEVVDNSFPYTTQSDVVCEIRTDAEEVVTSSNAESGYMAIDPVPTESTITDTQATPYTEVPENTMIQQAPVTTQDQQEFHHSISQSGDNNGSEINQLNARSLVVSLESTEDSQQKLVQEETPNQIVKEAVVHVDQSEAVVLDINQQTDQSEAVVLDINQQTDQSEAVVLEISQQADQSRAIVLDMNQQTDKSQEFHQVNTESQQSDIIKYDLNNQTDQSELIHYQLADEVGQSQVMQYESDQSQDEQYKINTDTEIQDANYQLTDKPGIRLHLSADMQQTHIAGSETVLMAAAGSNQSHHSSHAQLAPSVEGDEGKSEVVSSDSLTQGPHVGVMLASDDVVTQELLASFLAESSRELNEDVTQTPQTVSTSQVTPSLKLAERIERDENGREQTVVYLMHDTDSIDTVDSRSTGPQATTATSTVSSTVLPAPASKPTPRPLQQRIVQPLYMAGGKSTPSKIHPNLSSLDKQSSADKLTQLQLGGKVYSKQNVCTVAPDGQIKQQEVVIEVVVDPTKTKESSGGLQGMRVIQPYTYSTYVGADSQIQSQYECTQCDYKTDKRTYLLKHAKIHEEMRPHLCTFPGCDYSSKTISNLRRHLLSHTDERKFPCLECNLKFKQKIHLDKHVNYIHRERMVKCEFCDYVCANKIPDLKLHLKRKHLKNYSDDPPTYLECDKCGFLAGSKQDLKQHFKFHKRGPELKLFCQHCSFVTDAKSRLERHLMIHTKEKPFSCSLCDYKASQKEHIKRHMRNWHSEDKQGKGQTDNSADGKDSTDLASQPSNQIVGEDSVQTTTSVTGHELTRETPSLPVAADEGSPVPPVTSCDITQTTGAESFQEQLNSMAEQVVVGSGETMIDESGNLQQVIVCNDEQQYVVTADNLQQSSQGNGVISRNKAGAQEVKPAAGAAKPAVKYQPPDYSEKPKSFACTHCTMKFVKLLSLYKHLHTQHSDILPNTEEEKLTCVVCDFRAPSHNSLLVHMRKHNNQDALEDREEPGLLYMCVLCKYMNGKRKNLYQHLKKKHKISIMVKKDGTASCVVEPNADVTVVASSQGQQVTEVVGLNQMTNGDQSKVVNILDLANSLTQKHDISHLIQKVELGDTQPAEQDAAEAIVDLATQSVELGHSGMELPSSAAILEADESGQRQLQISAQQLHALSSGDYIEINGETYKVELQGDSMTAVLCQEVTSDDMIISATQGSVVMTDHMVSMDQLPIDSDTGPQVVATNILNESDVTSQVVTGDVIPEPQTVAQVVATDSLPESDNLVQVVTTEIMSKSDTIAEGVASNITPESNTLEQVVATELIQESNTVEQVVATEMVQESNTVEQVVATEMVQESNTVEQVVATEMVQESNTVEQVMATTETATDSSLYSGLS